MNMGEKVSFSLAARTRHFNNINSFRVLGNFANIFVPFLKKGNFFYLITIMKVFVFLDLYQKRPAKEVDQQETGFAALRKRLASARSVADVLNRNGSIFTTSSKFVLIAATKKF